MRRRRVLLGMLAVLAVLVLLVLAAVLVWPLLTKPGPLTEADCGRVKPGMTVPEVDALFGTTGTCIALAGDASAIYAWPAGQREEIVVEFEHGRAVGGSARFQRHSSLPRPEEPFLDRLRRRLPW